MIEEAICTQCGKHFYGIALKYIQEPKCTCGGKLQIITPEVKKNGIKD